MAANRRSSSRRMRAARRRKRRMDRVEHDLTDAVPACRSCNASKCNAEVTSWLRRKRLDERSFLLRHLEISTGLTPKTPTTPEPARPT